MKYITPIFLLISLVFIASSAAAEIYVWEDEYGKKHYSDSPPPEQKVETLTIKTDVKVDAHAQKRRADMQTYLNSLDEQRADEAELAAERDKAKKKQQKRCAKALGLSLKEKKAGIAYTKEKDGSRRVWTNEERLKYKKDVQKLVKEEC